MVGHLNPNDYTKFKDGSNADITSGNNGDVMVEFPRRGLSITSSGSTIILRMTNMYNDPDFQYYAHIRSTGNKDKFYMGAYLGNGGAGMLRSISGSMVNTSQTLNIYRIRARNNGAGYDAIGIFQWLYMQAMYTLKYRNLDSKTVIGKGATVGAPDAVAGQTDTKGMDWGEQTGKLKMKLFGIEDMWGTRWQLAEGMFTDSSFNLFVSLKNDFNEAGTGYVNIGNVGAYGTGFMSTVYGTSEFGFFPRGYQGTATTYYCAESRVSAPMISILGGDNLWTGAGMYTLHLTITKANAIGNGSSRLMYL